MSVPHRRYNKGILDAFIDCAGDIVVAHGRLPPRQRTIHDSHERD
jgi:hypothetical protein